MLPLRSPSDASKCCLPGVPLSVDIFEPAFGTDAQARALASPISHVRPGLPPFLIFTAENDLPTLPEMASAFHQSLLHHGCLAQLVQVPKRNHNSIMFHTYHPDDPVAQATVEFIWRHRAPASMHLSRDSF
jgi:acetyl esterase/lipase